MLRSRDENFNVEGGGRGKGRLHKHVTSINLDRICGWIHRNPDRNAGSSFEASSVLTKVSSLQQRKKQSLTGRIFTKKRMEAIRDW